MRTGLEIKVGEKRLLPWYLFTVKLASVLFEISKPNVLGQRRVARKMDDEDEFVDASD
jgi:hypothetical protein